MAGLQIEEDASFERREWRMERLGWGVLVIGVLAALAGAFGDGPLSRTQAAAAAGRLTVDYDRIVRHSAASEMRVRIERSGGGAEAAFSVDLGYLREIEVASVTPEPSRVEHQGDRVSYVFVVGDATPSFEVILRYEPTRAGRLSGQLATSDGAVVSVRQFSFF